MQHLMRVPNFIFYQGDVVLDGEYPFQVSFYRDNVVTIKQLVDGEDREIVLKKEYVAPLMKAILKMFPEAQKLLEEK